MKKLLSLVGFFILTPFLLLFSLVFLAFLQHSQSQNSFATTSVLAAETTVAMNQPLPNLTYHDGRLDKLQAFLRRYKSPLSEYTQLLIDAADLYNLDYRLLPAIAMQESNLCLKAPVDSYNCWGFGMYDKKAPHFDGYPEAINTVAKTLSRDYISKGLVEPEDIMRIYTPSNNGSWAFSVRHFMEQIN